MQLLAFTAVLAAIVLPSLAQSFQVNTPPSCLQCAACLLTWSETPDNKPYILSILPAGQTAAPPLVPAIVTNQTMQTFLAPFQVNTQFTVAITDNVGTRQFSSPIPVVAGPNSNCVNAANFNPFPGNNVTSGSSGGGSGSPTSSGTSGSATSTNPAGSSSSNSPSGSGTSGTSSPTGSSSSPKQTSSAIALTSSFLGIFGVLIVALLA